MKAWTPYTAVSCAALSCETAVTPSLLTAHSPPPRQELKEREKDKSRWVAIGKDLGAETYSPHNDDIPA